VVRIMSNVVDRIPCPYCDCGGPGMEERTKDITMEFHSEFDSTLDRKIVAAVVMLFCPFCGEAFVTVTSDDAETEV